MTCAGSGPDVLASATEDHRANIRKGPIVSAGETCQEVTATFLQSDAKGDVIWNARVQIPPPQPTFFPDKHSSN